MCMSCIVVAVWQPCFVPLLLTVYVMCCFCCLATMLRAGLVDSVCHCCFCCLATMLHAGLVDSVCHVLFLLSGDHASCRSCRQCMSCAVFAVWRPCFVRVLSTVYVMCCFCCLATMLRAGLVDSVCHCCFCCLATMLRAGLVDSVCNCCFCCLATMLHADLIAGLQSCFVWLVDSVCHELFLLSGDHVCVGIVDSVCHVLLLLSYTNIAIWEPYFVQVVLALYLMLLWPSGNHASCQHFVIYILLVLCQVLLLFVWS